MKKIWIFLVFLCWGEVMGSFAWHPELKTLIGKAAAERSVTPFISGELEDRASLEFHPNPLRVDHHQLAVAGAYLEYFGSGGSPFTIGLENRGKEDILRDIHRIASDKSLKSSDVLEQLSVLVSVLKTKGSSAAEALDGAKDGATAEDARKDHPLASISVGGE